MYQLKFKAVTVIEIIIVFMPRSLFKCFLVGKIYYAHQGCIYLIINVNQISSIVRYNIFNIIFLF